MLYERWQRIARDRRFARALTDLATGRAWTFAELAAIAETSPETTERLACPSGITPEFILAVLRGWRTGAVVCPLEPGQLPPSVPERLPRSIVHLKMTSASTGESKLVAFTAAQLAADVENIVQTMGLRSSWPNLGVISLGHSYGFSNLVLPLLLHGIPLVLVGSALPESLRSLTGGADAFTLPAVPALWRAWHAAGTIGPGIKLGISAGAPLPLVLEQEVHAAAGLKIHNFYGSSECGGIAYDSSEQPRTDASAVGAPMRNVEVAVGFDGCLEVRSRAVAETYWPEPSPALANGLFRTSDIGAVVGGMVFLRGRAGDQINVAGRKVPPEVVERALSGHPQVRDCLVFGVPGMTAERGERIIACVALKTPVAGDALRRFLTEKLPDWQVPREYWPVDSLQTNARGKTSRTDLRRRYLETGPRRTLPSQ